MSQSMPTISPGLMIKKIDRWAEEMRLLSKGEVNESKLNQAKKLQGNGKNFLQKNQEMHNKVLALSYSFQK